MPSHGSLSKAGRIRKKVGHMKIFREVTKGPMTVKRFHKRKHKCPRVANRNKYRKRVTLGRPVGNAPFSNRDSTMR